MCGIIGYIGSSEATPILIDGLRRLEYRGYDSAGVATLANGEMELRKCAGRIASLTQMVQKDPDRTVPPGLDIPGGLPMAVLQMRMRIRILIRAVNWRSSITG